MRRHRTIKTFIICISAIVIITGTFFGLQFFTKTGFFKINGIVNYDDSLAQNELDILKSIFTEDVILNKNVSISAKESFSKPEAEPNEFLYEILVPVTDFYSTQESITSEEITALKNGESTNEDITLISINELDFTQKLLQIDGEYYLDEFNSGAIFRTISFSSEAYEEEIKPLVSEVLTKTFPEKDSVLTFAQTGVTALSRNMYTKLKSVNNAEYFAENIKNFLSKFDITHTSNEASFTDYASDSNICSDKCFLNTLTAIGVDVVELTGNHNLDCGDIAAEESVDMYSSAGIKTFGGGKTASEAAIPLQISDKETNITMLAYNLSTGGATYDETPGANQYYEEDAIANITEAKQRGDFVIVDIQYYECYCYPEEGQEMPSCDAPISGYYAGEYYSQTDFFRHLIDLGADIVVGTSAHQPQTFELYNDGIIYYGLGNLFFDQIWWPGTTRGLILSHYFYNGKLLQTKINPTIYDKSLQVSLMNSKDSTWLIERLEKSRP